MKPSDRNEGVASARTGVAWVIVIYLLSGTCSLMDEVCWARLLKLTLGNTVYASTIVVSTFMAGLALGALIMGRYADRIRRPLRLYAILEICATITAVLIPFALRLADKAYLWSFAALDPSPTMLLSLQIVVSAAILLVPTMLMGSTLPLLSRYVTTLETRAGALVGRLYALNMLGAALGCFLAGFILIRIMGVMGTLAVAAALNLVVALGGFIISTRATSLPAAQATPEPAERKAAGGSEPQRAGRGLLILACFTSGFVSVGCELAWMRAIGYKLGVFTYVFTAVLTVYLLGNVIGALLGGRLSKRIANPAGGFGASLILLGATGVLFAPWIVSWYTNVDSLMQPMFDALAQHPELSRMVAPILHCLGLFLLPSILMGIGFPLAIQAWNNQSRSVGRTTATVYSANTIGSVAGGVFTGLALIPLLGMQTALTALGFFSTAIGVLLLLMVAREGRLILRLASAAVAVAVLAAGFAIPKDYLNSRLLAQRGMETFAILEGVNTTASMRDHRTPGGRTLWIASGNIMVGGDGVSRTAQKTLGHLGVLLNPRARSVLSVGFGSGETTDCLAMHDLDRIDCVEIAPEMVGVALEYLSRINLGDALEQHVNMIYMDAKNYLHLTTRRYDLILNDSNTPSQPGSAPLFAKEHFENALEHLNPGGLFITKLHMDHVPISEIDSIFGTFLEVFPSVSVWFPVTRPYQFFYVAGSRERQMYSPAHIERSLNDEVVRESVSFLHWENSQDVLCGYLGDETDLRRHLGEYQVNTDLRPFVEFNLDPNVATVRSGYFAKFVETLAGDSLFAHIDWGGMTESDRRDWLEKHRASRRISAVLLEVFTKAQGWEKLFTNYHALRGAPGNAALRGQKERILSGMRKSVTADSAARVLQTTGMALSANPEADAVMVVRSWALAELGRQAEALNVAREAAALAPDSLAAVENLGEQLFLRGEYEPAAEQFTRAIDLTEDRPRALFNLADAYEMLGRTAEARELYLEVLRLDPRHPDALTRTEPLGEM